MTLVLRELERVDHRVLGALRIVDGATGAPLELPMLVSAAGARIVRSRSGLYVIAAWAALAAHAESFAAPPATPSAGDETLVVTITDPSGRYLPRSVAMDLPRDPTPGNATQADSLFRALEVPMYPGTTAPVVGNWAAVRVTLSEAHSQDALGGALLRVMAGAKLLALGLSDWRGEALVPVVGIPVTTWSTEPGAVIISEIAATLQAGFDANSGTRVSAADVAAGRAPKVLPRVDPSRLAADFAGLRQANAAVMLAASRPLHVPLQIDLSQP